MANNDIDPPSSVIRGRLANNNVLWLPKESLENDLPECRRLVLVCVALGFIIELFNDTLLLRGKDVTVWGEINWCIG
jgi:hypothetical protein